MAKEQREAQAEKERREAETLLKQKELDRQYEIKLKELELKRLEFGRKTTLVSSPAKLEEDLTVHGKDNVEFSIECD